MTIDEFRQLAEAWGGTVARWPSAVRADAEALAAGSPHAAAILADADRLDRSLAALRPQVSADRADRLAGRVATRIAAEPAPARGWLQRWFMPATSFASAAVIGVGLGLALPLAPPINGAELLTVLVVDAGAVTPNWFLQ